MINRLKVETNKIIFFEKVVGGWMDKWVEVKAVLCIAYKRSKNVN
jgi:hypothetical protein